MSMPSSSVCAARRHRRRQKRMSCACTGSVRAAICKGVKTTCRPWLASGFVGQVGLLRAFFRKEHGRAAAGALVPQRQRRPGARQHLRTLAVNVGKICRKRISGPQTGVQIEPEEYLASLVLGLLCKMRFRCPWQAQLSIFVAVARQRSVNVITGQMIGRIGIRTSCVGNASP